MAKAKLSNELEMKIRTNLGSNRVWAERAILRLYEEQTATEKEAHTTAFSNGVGFSAVDADILSSFAEQLNRGRFLSERQLSYAFKVLPKYAKQLARLAKSK